MCTFEEFVEANAFTLFHHEVDGSLLVLQICVEM